MNWIRQVLQDCGVPYESVELGIKVYMAPDKLDPKHKLFVEYCERNPEFLEHLRDKSKFTHVGGVSSGGGAVWRIYPKF
jgi:hypothetical protein